MATTRKDNNLERVAETSQLFDLYGGLLTEKKREVMQLYYEDDLSLSEIADELGVSRAAVHDSLRSAEKLLRGYEEKLGMLGDYQRRKTLVESLTAELDVLKSEVGTMRSVNASTSANRESDSESIEKSINIKKTIKKIDAIIESLSE